SIGTQFVAFASACSAKASVFENPVSLETGFFILNRRVRHKLSRLGSSHFFKSSFATANEGFL
ncbi:hypothetical protein, partial [Flavobacterium sp.]|uniref:hypothetical protein n=1 Tax=Flavobacterium sp. TaxID=239 RepID=UPI0038FC7719